MKNKALLILIYVLSSCSQMAVDRGDSIPAQPTSTRKQLNKQVSNDRRSKAIFHLIAPSQVKLGLVHIGTKKQLQIPLENILSEIDLKSGDWQITEFLMDHKSYKTMNVSKQFIFQVRKNKDTYVGSYIFQCPQVTYSQHKEMKEMVFFNRYPYSSKDGLCELLVGSDFKGVKKLWEKKHPKVPLSVGF